MNKYFPRIIIILSAFTIAFFSNRTEAQNVKQTNTKKTEVKVNEMEVIYEEDDYEDLMIDERPQDEQQQPTVPNLLAPPPLKYEDEDEIIRQITLQESEDEGAEHEDDILYAGLDSNMIHYPRKSFGADEVVHITLVDDKHKFAFPTPPEARVTSHYGPRRRFHYGVDLAQPTGKDIYAAFDGVVRVSRFNKSYGNLIVIRHDNGLETYYAHLSQRYAKVGKHVKAGDVIGLCGNTGRSYGSHLHFEIRYLGNAMNPEHVIDCTNHKLINNELTLTQNSFRKVADTRTVAGNQKSGGAQYHKVKSGDTLGKIAARYHTTVRRLCQLNGIKQTTTLSVGRRLRVR